MIIPRPPFIYGWTMIGIALVIPLAFSWVVGFFLKGIEIDDMSRGVIFLEVEDYSHIFNYLGFGFLHFITCLAITYYVFDIIINNSSRHLFAMYKRHLMMAFFLASLSFLLIVLTLDTSLEILSSDFLWVGLEKTTSDSILFKQFIVNGISIGRFFDIIPVILVIAGFLPASSIMLAIPIMVENVELSQSRTADEIVLKFLNEFEVLYYLMVGMLLSSGLATHFYLKTPLMTIDYIKSVGFENMLNSIFIIWSLVYCFVLLMVLLFSYWLISSNIRLTSISNDLLSDANRYREIRVAIIFQFMIKKKSALFASAFSPIILVAIKQAFS